MTELTPSEYLRFLQELNTSKYTVESFSYQMSGGRFTRLTLRTGHGKHIDHMTIPAELFDSFAEYLQPGAMY